MIHSELVTLAALCTHLRIGERNGGGVGIRGTILAQDSEGTPRLVLTNQAICP